MCVSAHTVCVSVCVCAHHIYTRLSCQTTRSQADGVSICPGASSHLSASPQSEGAGSSAACWPISVSPSSFPSRTCQNLPCTDEYASLQHKHRANAHIHKSGQTENRVRNWKNVHLSLWSNPFFADAEIIGLGRAMGDGMLTTLKH